MRQLFTVTANLLAETTCTYASVTPGATHRAQEESFQVGGKGINVARMAERLGLPSTAVCFPGGQAGARCQDWLAGQPFASRGFVQQAETRAGWVARCGDLETTFLGRDRPVESDAWGEAMAFLARELKSGDALAICGSIPGWSPEIHRPLEELLARVTGEAFLAIDTYGTALRDLAGAPVDLIKINRDELQGWVGEKDEPVDVIGFLRSEQCARLPAKRWVITDGGETIFGRGERGQVLRVQPPRVEVVSPVGSGDVMLAAMLSALVRDRLPFRESLCLGARLAAANAASGGVAEFDLVQLPELPQWEEL